jgi:rare lipoprotein A
MSGAFAARIAPRLAVVLMAGASLAACATSRPSGGRLPHGVASQGTTRTPPPAAFVDPDTGKPLRGTMKPYQVRGQWYFPAEQPGYDAVGIGSWYGEQFHNHTTSDGEVFDMDQVSAAHKTLPLPSMVEVTNLDNGRKMTVRVNDRGPFVDGRIIDLSRAAAEQLGYRQQGVARVRVRYLGPAPASLPRTQIARATPPRPATPDLPPIGAVPAAMPAVIAAPAAPAYDPAPAYQQASIQPAAGPLPPERFSAPQSRLAAPAGYRVQAGAFSSLDNAQRAVSQVADAGEAVIEPMQRPSGMLYRVVVGPAPDEATAWAMRDRIAALGFRDASILRP